MQFYHVGAAWILIIGLLSSCGGNTAGSVTPPPGAETALPRPGPSNPQGAGYPAEADEVVRSFLSSLQEDLSGSSSVKYLSSERQQEVLQGRPLPVILGFQEIYSSFAVSETLPARDVNTTYVTATLDLGRPVERAFELIKERGEWHIIDVIPLVDGAFPPDQVVADFLDALYADPSGELSAVYLAPSLRQRLQQSGLAVLDIEAPYDSFSVPPTDVGGSKVSVEATLYFGSDEVQRTFSLIRQGSSWQISAIR